MLTLTLFFTDSVFEDSFLPSSFYFNTCGPLLSIKRNYDFILKISITILFIHVNFFLKKKLLEQKGKYRKQGLFLKGGYNFSSFSDSFIGLGWVWETFKIDNTKRSFIFELGPDLFFNHWLDDPLKSQYSGNKIYFSIYFMFFKLII